MVGASLLSHPYLCMQPLLQSPPKIWLFNSVNFYLPTPSLLFDKFFLKIPGNTPFLFTSAISHHPIFAYNHPSKLHQKYFPYVNHLANLGCFRGPSSYGVF